MSRNVRTLDSTRILPETANFSLVLVYVMVVTTMLGAVSGLAAESPVGKWKTVDDKSGQVRSEWGW